MRFNNLRRTECFYGKSPGHESSEISSNKTISGMITRQSRLRELNHLFKAPNQLPVKRANVKALISPRRRVQTGRVKNDKSSQQSKMSFLPHTSFINSRKTICSRTNPNARREVIKKMVFLAECALKENIEIKQSTPVKFQVGITPRKTPRSKGYLALPEFKSMGIKLRTPIQDTIRKETISNSTQLSFTNDSFLGGKEESKANCELDSSYYLQLAAASSSELYGDMLRHCRIYNTEVGFIYGKLKMLEECFEKNIKELPDYQVYDEFASYQSKKEELYEELRALEDKFKTFITNHTQVGSKLKDYVKKRKELFEKRRKLHKDFEEVVKSAMEQYQKIEILEEDKKEKEEEVAITEEKKEQTSRIPKRRAPINTTPVTKLNVKSKEIQKGRKKKP